MSRATSRTRVFLAPDAIATAINEVVLLGLHEERAFFACDLSEVETPQEVVRAEQQAQFIDLRRVGPLLPRHEGSVLAFARGMAYWQSRHRYCGLCGARQGPRKQAMSAAAPTPIATRSISRAPIRR